MERGNDEKRTFLSFFSFLPSFLPLPATTPFLMHVFFVLIARVRPRAWTWMRTTSFAFLFITADLDDLIGLCTVRDLDQAHYYKYRMKAGRSGLEKESLSTALRAWDRCLWYLASWSWDHRGYLAAKIPAGHVIHKVLITTSTLFDDVSLDVGLSS